MDDPMHSDHPMSRDEGQSGRVPPVTHFTLILRIWRDRGGHVWGQVVEPLEEKRMPFQGEDGLWRLLEERVGRAGAPRVDRPPGCEV